MSWLYLYIARFATGERWRKATPAEQRHFAGLFFIIPVCFELFILTMKSDRQMHLLSLLDKAGAFMFWLVFTLATSALFFASVFWGRRVPTRVSVILAIIAWLVLIGTLFHYDFLMKLHDT